MNIAVAVVTILVRDYGVILGYIRVYSILVSVLEPIKNEVLKI